MVYRQGFDLRCLQRRLHSSSLLYRRIFEFKRCQADAHPEHPRDTTLGD